MGEYADRLVKIRAAIDKILDGGQEVEYDGKTWKAADIEALERMERRYVTYAAREARGGGIRVRGGTPV